MLVTARNLSISSRAFCRVPRNLRGMTVANKWLEALKSKNTLHNTEEDCARENGRSSKGGGENRRTRENPPVKTAKTPSKNGHTPENVPAKTAKTNGTPTKRVKKKLTSEEE